MTREFVCIVCPNSCRLTVSDDSGQIRVTGNRCKRGREHGISEFTRPMRMLTGTVVIRDAELPRLSVISTGTVPRDLVDACQQVLRRLRVTAPVRAGDVILSNILNTGVDIIASRTMKAKE